MNTTHIQSHIEKSNDRIFLKKRDERLFQVLFVLSFPVFLAVVFATRLLPAGSENKKQTSMLNEARESARSTIALALTD